MRTQLFALIVGFALGYASTVGIPAEAVNPPSPLQPHSDLYECCGYTGEQFQSFNPISQQLKGTNRTVRFRWQVVSGCNSGNMRQTLQMAIDASAFLGVSIVEDPNNYAITIRANCGTGFVNICGSGAIACLGRGFPSQNDIDASTQMAAFYNESQMSIWLHELFGHALGTWHEQYCLGTEITGPCAGRPQFSPAPGFVDFMNTGPDSRYMWPQFDIDRWERTMYLLAPTVEDPPYRDCMTYAGWEPTVSCFWPAYGEWIWTIPLNGHDSIWHWSVSQPVWRCTEGCP